MKSILRGFQTGMLLQLAIGPVFLFIANTALQKGWGNALAAVLGVTLADYLYIVLALMGVGKLLETGRIKQVFSWLGAIVLMGFGGWMAYQGFLFREAAVHSVSADHWGSFIAAFALTISSPLTIVFWTSIFATKSMEYGLNPHELRVFGLAAGFSTFVFLGGSTLILSLFQAVIPTLVIQLLNILVGGGLVVYGGLRLWRTLGPSNNKC